MNTAECPECGGTISFTSAPVLHELVQCAACGKELEATNIDPIEVAAPEEAEDWVSNSSCSATPTPRCADCPARSRLGVGTARSVRGDSAVPYMPGRNRPVRAACVLLDARGGRHRGVARRRPFRPAPRAHYFGHAAHEGAWPQSERGRA
jgi:alpha-aminoadipate carrier protein LysW